MATGVISNTLLTPSGAALASVTVKAHLKPGPGFRISTGTEITNQTTTDTDVNGHYSITLEQNANITPASSWYEIEEQIPEANGGPRVWAVECAAGTNTLYASLITPASNPALASYLTQESADARYATLASIGGALGTTTAGTASSAYLAGLGLTAAEADYGSDEGGQGVAGRTRTTNGILCPSTGLSGTGGLNSGVKADPAPAAYGIGAHYQILAQINNAAGVTDVIVPSGEVKMLFWDQNTTTFHVPGVTWQESMSPVSVPYTVAAGATGQIQVWGEAMYLGVNPPTQFGEAQIKLTAGHAAKLQIICLVSYVPLLRGPNPGTNISTNNQILE